MALTNHSLRSDPIRQVFQENEDWYRDVVEHGHDLLCLHDLEGHLIAINPAPARVLGYTVEELLRTPMREFVPVSFRPLFDEYLRLIALQGTASGLLAVVTRSGERRIWEYHNTLRTEGVAKPIVRGVAHDVTEQKRIEGELRKSEERYRSVIAALVEGVVLVDAEGRLIASNPSAERILGIKPERLSGAVTTARDWEPYTIREDGSPFPAESYPAIVTLRTGEPQRNVCIGVRQTQGGVRWVLANSEPLRRADADRPYAVGVSLSDITERKEAEAQLRQSESELKEAQRVARTGSFRRNLTTDEVVWSEQLYRMLGLEPKPTQKLPLSRLSELVVPESREPWRQAVDNLRASGQPMEVEVGFRHRNGNTVWLLLRAEADRDGNGNIVGSHGIALDITERKRAARALASSESRFRALYDRSPIGISLVDARTGRFLQANTRYCEIVGRTEQDLLARDFQSITHPGDLTANLMLAERLATGTAPYYEMEKRFLRPDGSVRRVHVHAASMSQPENQAANLVMVEDITEHKRAADALRESEQRLSVALKNAPIAVFNQDRNLRFTWVHNLAGEWAETDFLGKTEDDIFEAADAGRVRALKQEVLETGQGRREEFALTLQGKAHYCDLTVEPLRDAAGNVVGVNTACMDVTHLREITEELRQAKERLVEEKLYLEQTIDTELGFEEIIGRSKGLKVVMEQVAKVASSDATVLLLGETGVGKELVARALHRLSRRKGNSFIKMNCAAIPSGLLESELFGNEKGAFTGAVSRKAGRLELADKGTLFLDEIGEIPLPLQPKLLRVLQDQEFERLGGTQTLKVNFRLVAATNRDLLASVEQGHFRSDLFYRLNVFPVRIPPLRERRDDIPVLVEHFVAKCAKRMNKSITSIPRQTMDVLTQWDWPGNVRELENFIERSVILTHGSVLHAPLSELAVTPKIKSSTALKDIEREHILRALEQSRGKVSGPGGAAARLGLKRTTLQAKLKHLGIRPSPSPGK